MIDGHFCVDTSYRHVYHFFSAYFFLFLSCPFCCIYFWMTTCSYLNDSCLVCPILPELLSKAF
uniref:Uncharacterized protein n=1 Tax=Arundo donax TaxID=35708 RepID=A0A0A9F0A9_ARUDO